MDRRQFCAGIVAGALPVASARAQTWPDKPVNIILSQPPGSGPDNIARLLADRLGHMWGKVVVILNKPGGQNIIGAQAAARSAPDGYTFYFATTAALVSNVYLFKQLPYDPLKDFDPVAFVATSPFGLMVSGPSPIRSIDEFIAASKAAPDKLTLANEGPRTLGGMAARLFNARAGIRNNLVPYASASVGIQDALAGRVDALIVDLAATTQHIKHGDLCLLATTSAARIEGWDSDARLVGESAGLRHAGMVCRGRPGGHAQGGHCPGQQGHQCSTCRTGAGREDFRDRSDRGPRKVARAGGRFSAPGTPAMERDRQGDRPPAGVTGRAECPCRRARGGSFPLISLATID